MAKPNGLRRIAPFVVLTAALSFSAWSLYYVARHLGAPIPVAVVVSTIFDGGAVYLADLGADHTREGDSGLGPRVAVFILAGISAWLNTLHAKYGGYPESSILLWAAPPIVAVVIYEFTIRFQHRKSLRRDGRIPLPLPKFDTASWFLFPVKTLRAMRRVVEFRREVTAAVATGEPMPLRSPNSGRGSVTVAQTPRGVSQTSQTPALTTGTNSANPVDVRTWARAAGLPVGLKGPIPVDVYRMYREAKAAAQLAAESPEGEFGTSSPEFGTSSPEFDRSLGEFQTPPGELSDGQGDDGQSDGQGDGQDGTASGTASGTLAASPEPGEVAREAPKVRAAGQ
jgi:Protein of unknown function (DUF2637)